MNNSMTAKKIWMRAIIAIIIVGAVLWGMFHVNLNEYPEASLWIKSVHVIAIICWMAGMLYLPRLFVYHCRSGDNLFMSNTFKIMERRLLRAIINPSMIISWITGLYLAWSSFHFHGGWLHLKILAVFILSAFHGFLSRGVRHFAEDKNKFSERTWRILNEVPTVLMIVAVVAVIVKPF